MPRTLPTLRPKRPTGTVEQVTEASQTPTPSVVSLSASATETSSSPSTTPPELPRRQSPVAQKGQTLYRPNAWPSQVTQHNSTMWLLPVRSDQASAITTLLRTEIDSHNITREMLHATEQRRLEAVQRCGQLQADNSNWSTAYNNLTAALCRCSEEYARLSAENTAMKTQMNGLNSQTLYPLVHLDAVAPKDRQIRVLRKKLSRRYSDDRESASSDVEYQENEVQMSLCASSPESST